MRNKVTKFVEEINSGTAYLYGLSNEEGHSIELDDVKLYRLTKGTPVSARMKFRKNDNIDAIISVHKSLEALNTATAMAIVILNDKEDVLVSTILTGVSLFSERGIPILTGNTYSIGDFSVNFKMI